MDALLGAASVLGEFSAEYDAGSRTYERTIKRAAFGVAQASINGAIAIGTAAAVGAIGIAGTPALLIGGATALGIGYLSNQAINYFF
jgi:hypothetical protein